MTPLVHFRPSLERKKVKAGERMRLGALVKRAEHGQSSVVDVANLRSTDESGENKGREKKGERMSHGPLQWECRGL